MVVRKVERGGKVDIAIKEPHNFVMELSYGPNMLPREIDQPVCPNVNLIRTSEWISCDPPKVVAKPCRASNENYDSRQRNSLKCTSDKLRTLFPERYR